MQSGAKQFKHEEQVFTAFILYKLEQLNIPAEDVIVKLERDNSLPDAVRLSITCTVGLPVFAMRKCYGFNEDNEVKPISRAYLTGASSTDIAQTLGLDRWTMRSMVEAAAQDEKDLDPLKAMLWKVA